jgi:hypothetical protein
MKIDLSETIKDVLLFALGIAFLFFLSGCATKTRNVELDGMYANEAGTLAIGSLDVMAAPMGEESAMIRYEEDVSWFVPHIKTHEIKIMLTGTNAVEKADEIVKNICEAFTQVAVTNRINSL